MEQQRHVVKRQLVEITLSDEQSARPIQERLAGFFQQRFPQLLDRALSDFSPPDSLQRFERVELDLGVLTEDELSDGIEGKLEAILRTALRNLFGKNAIDSPRQPDLAQTGPENLPIFSGKRTRSQTRPTITDLPPDPESNSDQKIELIDRSPAETGFLSATEAGLRQVLTEKTADRTLSKPIDFFRRDEPANDRGFLKNEDTADLELLVYFLLEGHLPWWADNARHGAPEQALVALFAAATHPLPDLLANVLRRPKALQRTIRYFNDDLLRGLAGLLATDDERIVILADALYKQVLPLAQNTAKPTSEIRSSLWRCLFHAIVFNRSAYPDWDTVAISVVFGWADVLDLGYDAQASMMTESIQPTEGNVALAQMLQSLTDLFSEMRIRQSVYRQDSQQAITGENEAAYANSYGNQASSVEHQVLAPADTTAKQKKLIPEGKYGHQPNARITIPSEPSAFSASEVIYIDNAGLCILWPYLTPFFERLALVENGRFPEPSAQHCGVALLQYLATGSTDTPEYLLSFNKLLCGMATDTVFELTEPLSDTQLAACEDLLTSAIANAPILNNISHNGFRGSFLLRNGLLSSEAGNWLLRVERKTYDAVLDRFPWQWQWFKLPWMDHPVRVEW